MSILRAFLVMCAVLPVGCHGPDPERVLLDLESAESSAEVLRETPEIDIGTLADLPHLVRGWSHTGRRKDDVTFRWVEGDQAEIRFFLASPRALTIRLKGWPYHYPGAPQQRVAVALNGTDLAGFTMLPGRRTNMVEAPEMATRAGMNNLLMRFSHCRRVSEVKDSDDQRILAAAWDVIAIDQARSADVLPTEAHDAVEILAGSELGVFFPASAGSRLLVDRLESLGADGAEVSVLWSTDSEDAELLAQWAADGGGHQLILPEFPAGSPVRLGFRIAGTAHGVRLHGARVVARGPEDHLRSELPQPFSTGPAPNMVLYVVDTLRADRLGCYGYHRGTSPRLDEFAAGAVRFSRAIAPTSWTKPSVASILSGRSTLEHGVNSKEQRVPEAVTSLAEHLGAAGYASAAFTANAYLTERAGFAQGFDDFDFAPDRAMATTKKAIAWLDRADAHRPLLLWIHTIDPHAPYEPDEDYRRRFAPRVSDDAIGSVDHIRAVARREIPATDELVTAMNDLYDAEVAQNDAAFGTLLDALDRLAIADESVVVFVSDHGDAFGERGVFGHGWDLHGETLRVPLVIRFPGSQGMVVDRSVLVTDLVPTILDLCGIEADETSRRRSLRQSWQLGPAAAERALVSFLDYDGRRGIAVQLGRWKMIEPLSVDFSSGRQLYDLQLDPGEEANLADSMPVRAGWLASMARQALTHAVAPKPEDGAIGPEEEQALRALGYLD